MGSRRVRMRDGRAIRCAAARVSRYNVARDDSGNCNGRGRPRSRDAADGRACDGTGVRAGEDADRLDRHGRDGLVDVRAPDRRRIPGDGLQPDAREGQGRWSTRGRSSPTRPGRSPRRPTSSSRSSAIPSDVREVTLGPDGTLAGREAGVGAGGHDDQRAGPGRRDRRGRQGQGGPRGRRAGLRRRRRRPRGPALDHDRRREGRSSTPCSRSSRSWARRSSTRGPPAPGSTPRWSTRS